MGSVFLFLHIATAVVLMGAVMYSTSAFAPALARAGRGDSAALASVESLHGASKLYGAISAVVPVLGFIVLIVGWDFFSDQGQYHAAGLLCVIAWAILFAVILPTQKKAIAALATPGTDVTKQKKKLSMFSGIFNLLWIIALVLMLV